jgi:hypothetical protein
MSRGDETDWFASSKGHRGGGSAQHEQMTGSGHAQHELQPQGQALSVVDTSKFADSKVRAARFDGGCDILGQPGDAANTSYESKMSRVGSGGSGLSNLESRSD